MARGAANFASQGTLRVRQAFAIIWLESEARLHTLGSLVGTSGELEVAIRLRPDWFNLRSLLYGFLRRIWKPRERKKG
jgi:hypothetical protein